MKTCIRIVLVLAGLATADVCLAAGPTTMKWTIDGVERQALVFAPSTSANTAKAKAPVVFGFHGHGGNMQGTANMMKFQQVWPQAIVVYPQGLKTASTHDPAGERPGWQHEPGEEGDRDLKLFDAILATLHTKYAVNDDRIYVAGFSNGSGFSFLLWGTRGQVVAAVGICAGILNSGVHLTVPRPVMHIAGSADHTADFATQQQTMDTERQFNGCNGPGQPCGTGCKRYASTKHAPVVNIIHPGGHVFPPWASGKMVPFFKEHPRHP
jgi:polyhydroxybutyrate depolymerase